MSKHENIDELNKIKILQRLKRIEGQIRGIQGMLLDNRSYEEILMQVSAVKSALNRVNKLILEEKVNSCFNYSEEIYLPQSALDEIIELINRFVR
jgi:CsoR family transcriptional regulator, copper-sensing transcriptional repressor